MFKRKDIYAQAVPYIMPSFDTSKEEVLLKDEQKEIESQDMLTINKIQELEREAYESGFKSGQKAGFEMGEQKALLLIQRLEKIISDLAELRSKELEKLEKQILELSVALAKRIVLKELSLNLDIIVNVIREALMKLQRTESIRIRIHPSLQEVLSRNNANFRDIAPDLIFELDNQLPLYGAVIIGSYEIVSTDIDEQLNNILDDIGLKIAKD